MFHPALLPMLPNLSEDTAEQSSTEDQHLARVERTLSNPGDWSFPAILNRKIKL
jgi:hypothetical protein